jgi:hypothetical protein
MIGKKINQLATELAPVSTDLTIIGDPTTGVSKKITLAQLGAIFSGAVAFYTNLAGFPATGSLDIIYCAKDTQKLYLWSGSAYVEVFPSQALLDTYQLRSEKGNANGYASLDSLGKVPISQLPSSLMEYKGMWNAATNTPTLANGTGDTGDVYICNVAGTVNFGAGPITFAVGDYVIYSGTIWQRSSGAVGTVTSVAATITGDSLTISGSPVTTSGTLAFAFNGTTAQYIRGNGTLATFPSLTGYVPYTGATTNLDLGTHTLLAKNLVINHSSGSGVAASITKGGSGEALTVVKSSGSGNAASITGGVTLLDELHLNTDLADAYIASATNWNAAYNDKINSAAVTGTTTKTLTLTQQDGGTITASWTDDNTDAVTSVFGRTGAVVAVSGDYNTSQVTENTNLYFTNARAIASTLTGYTSGAGTITSSDSILSAIQKLNGNIGALTTGVSSVNGLTGAVTLTTSNIAEGTNLYYTEARVSANTDVAANTAARHNAVTIGTANGLSLSTQVLSLGLASTSTTGALSSTDWNTFNNKTSNTGTVTSVGLSSATSGVTIGSTPITTSGTITLAIATASGSQQGLLSSTDWTTFNNKQNALTNPVTGTGTTNYLPKFTGASTIGDSAVSDDGTTVTLNSRALSGTSATFSTTLQTTGLLCRREASGSDGFIAYLTTGVQNTVMGFNNSGSTNAQGVLNNYSYFGNLNAYGVQFTTNGIVAMTINTSGNLGLGVTPSAGMTVIRSMQLGYSGIIAGQQGTAEVLYMGSNWLFDGAFRYQNNGFATRFLTSGGAYEWGIAPSGTAGNAISFTQAMTLDASGRLGIGTTSPAAKLHAVGSGIVNIVQSSNTVSYTQYYNSSTGTNSTNDGLTVGLNGIDAYIFSREAGNLVIGTSDTERMRITSDGNVGIGTTDTSNGILNLNGVLDINKDSATVGARWRRGATTVGYIGTGDWAVNGLGTSDFGISSGSSGALVFGTQGGGERMRITSGGLVGIGTSAPTQALHVVGNSYISGRLDVGMTPSPFWNARFRDYSDGSGVYIGSVSAGGYKFIAGDSYYENSGNWYSDNTTSAVVNLTGGNFTVYTNSGLTANTNFTPTARFNINPSGAATFNGTLGINGVSDNIKSGTYTPTLSSIYNVASSTAFVCQYMRVGNVVTVSGVINVTATATNTWTRISMTLPISSNFDFSYRAGGGGGANSTNNVCVILAGASTSVVYLDAYPNSTNSLSYYFSYTYQII